MEKITTFIKENWGFLLLSILLVVVILVNIRPGLFLAGWDNFSATSNLGLNIERAILLVYRSFRGYGVQSDSEVVDLFRLLLFSILSPFLKAELLDQIYLLASLAIGVIATYALSKQVFKKFITEKYPKQATFYLEVIGLTAGFFYLFNLNTLATFYTPIVMFTARYWFYPTIFWLIVKIVNERKFTITTFTLFILISLLGATSYLTATVFVVLMVVMILVVYFMNNPLSPDLIKSLKISLLVGVLFVAINLFWFLPFLNYALSKSEAVTNTSNNIFINEHVLNASPVKYTPYRILVLFPDILDLAGPTDMDTGSAVDIYENRDLLIEDPLVQVLLLTFSVLAIAGSILIIFHARRYSLMFIPILVFFTYFVLFKDRPPLGFIFESFARYIPLFEEVFRFGETKFMPILALFGSLGAGFAVYFWVRIISMGSKGWIGKTIALVIVTIFLFAPQIYTFQSYFQGDLVWDFLYVDIPQEYEEVAEFVDEYPDALVLHLPFDEFSYWRVHSWGYFGSSFLNFQMESSVMDRTFEPGSFENDDMLQLILSSVKKEDKEAFLNSIENAGVDYIIFDESVKESMDARGVKIWGEYHSEEVALILNELEKEGKISKVKTTSIDIEEISKNYGYWNDLPDSVKEEIGVDNLIVYKIVNQEPPAKLLTDVRVLENQVPVQRSSTILNSESFLQGEDFKADLLPLLVDSADVETSSQITKMEFEKALPSTVITGSESDKNFLTVHMKKTGGDVEVALQRVTSPLASEEAAVGTNAYKIKIPASKIPELSKSVGSIEDYNSDWHIIDQKYMDNLSKYRLAVGDIVLPLPSNLGSEYEYITSVVVDGDNVEVQLISPVGKDYNLLGNLDYTENPNCVGDESEKYYKYDLVKGDKSTSISSEYGSTCVTGFLTELDWQIYPYYETEIQFTLNLEKVEEYDDPYDNPLYISEGTLFHEHTNSNEKTVAQAVAEMDEASYLRYCFIDAETLGCMNTHQLIGAGEENVAVTVPNGYINDYYNAQILFTLPSWGANRTTAEISKLNIIGYDAERIGSVKTESIPVYKSQPKAPTQKIYIPKSLSPTSYYMGTKFDRFQTNVAVCDLVGTKRATKIYEGATISYLEACDSFLSIYNNYDPNSSYLWNTSYNLLAGKTPSYYFYPYLDQFISRYSEIGNIESFGALEQPDSPFGNFTTENVELLIEEAYEREDYVYLQSEVKSEAEYDYREFRINHVTGNQGVLKLNWMNIQELPGDWEDIVYAGKDSEILGVSGDIERGELSANGYKFEISEISNRGSMIINTGLGYDENWELYDGSKSSYLSMLFGGEKLEAEHVKLDGWADGWIVYSEDIQIDSGNAELITFYGPTRLMVLGSFVGVIAILAAGGVLIYKVVQNRHEKSK